MTWKVSGNRENINADGQCANIITWTNENGEILEMVQMYTIQGTVQNPTTGERYGASTAFEDINTMYDEAIISFNKSRAPEHEFPQRCYWLAAETCYVFRFTPNEYGNTSLAELVTKLYPETTIPIAYNGKADLHKIFKVQIQRALGYERGYTMVSTRSADLDDLVEANTHA